MASIKDPEIVQTNESSETEEVDESKVDVNLGLNKALATYRKLAEGGKDADPLTEQQESALVKNLHGKNLLEYITL